MPMNYSFHKPTILSKIQVEFLILKKQKILILKKKKNNKMPP